MPRLVNQNSSPQSLLEPDARTRGNYRQYGGDSLDRLRFIRSAQATGFSLDDIRQLLSLTHADEPPCDEVIALTKKRLADVRANGSASSGASSESCLNPSPPAARGMAGATCARSSPAFVAEGPRAARRRGELLTAGVDLTSGCNV